MKRNMGTHDRLIRAALAVLVVTLIPPDDSRPEALAAYLLATALALTSATGYSPAFALLRIDTAQDERSARDRGTGSPLSR